MKDSMDPGCRSSLPSRKHYGYKTGYLDEDDEPYSTWDESGCRMKLAVSL
jgi:hypothetical protein